MIVCPNCEHENLEGTIFCGDCGTQLVGGDSMVTQNINTTENLKIVEGAQTEFYPMDMDTWASLHLLDSGQILPLANRSEFTLGRVSDDQVIVPDIDLTPYKAYASGVSRLHAVLKHEGQQVHIKDLGSSNGTYINGERLKMNADRHLNHGDILSLGKMKIQILIR